MEEAKDFREELFQIRSPKQNFRKRKKRVRTKIIKSWILFKKFDTKKQQQRIRKSQKKNNKKIYFGVIYPSHRLMCVFNLSLRGKTTRKEIYN